MIRQIYDRFTKRVTTLAQSIAAQRRRIARDKVSSNQSMMDKYHPGHDQVAKVKIKP